MTRAHHTWQLARLAGGTIEYRCGNPGCTLKYRTINSTKYFSRSRAVWRKLSRVPACTMWRSER